MPISNQAISIFKINKLIVNQEYLSILEENGLLDFDDIYRIAGGELIKKIKERQIIKIKLTDKKGKHVFYLKKHYPKLPGIFDLLANFMAGRGVSEGVKEFKNICDFRIKGIPTIPPVVAGEKRDRFCRYRSFLITEDMSPYVSLEEIIFKYPEIIDEKRNRGTKKKIIKDIALFAKRMHAKGFNHRDFNATHILLNPRGLSNNICLGVFDLQRVDRKRFLRFKWTIKTIAELFYSLPEPFFDKYDRLYLYKNYKGMKRMNFVDKMIYLLIKSKEKKISKHTKRIKEKKLKNIRR